MSTRRTQRLHLLLQRSLRYSYRQRCWGCCPTILCELFFPFVVIFLLALFRYGSNVLLKEFEKSPASLFPTSQCSQQINQTASRWTCPTRINLVFQPSIAETKELVSAAERRLEEKNCSDVQVWAETITEERETLLLQNDTVIVDFGPVNQLKNARRLAYNLVVRMPTFLRKNDPIDFSFLSFLHPTFIADRTKKGALPDFGDVKVFVDELLISSQSNRSIEYQLERAPFSCTPFRRDFIYESGSALVTTILMMVDLVFLIPLIREKNAKVKEILKVLGIAPALNHLAQSIRTLIILCPSLVLLCIMFQFYSYFHTVPIGVLLLVYSIYSLQLLSFCIFNAQLFDRVVRAMLGTLFIYGVSLLIYPSIVVWPVGLQYLLMFISPFIGGYSLFQQLTLHDLAMQDVQFFRPIYRDVPMLFPSLLLMVSSSIFYAMCSWYVEKVFPGEYGMPADWNFLFQREEQHVDEWREDLPLTTTRSIVRVEHLVKRFGPDQIAVNDVSFDLHENQITSLLGPNGSGKTTIFNCLIGMLKQTSGRILIDNQFDTRTNIEMLRRSMGYCPQHDILFDLLTIEEQLQFYAVARGFPANIADEMLRRVNLQSSKHLFCQSLSGGMKRRLSLACAFIGETKIVLLDEPSSGLDPSNRRLLWDWLRSMKEGKTLLLTTHFMEEADALSDRVLILANGRIQVDGTSSELKEHYGSGYKLVIQKPLHTSSRDLECRLREYLPGLTMETDTLDGDVIFRTNQRPNDQFVQALKELEVMKQKEKIRNYGVQNSTMDDVFSRLTRQSNGIDLDRSLNTLEKQCHRLFTNDQFFIGFFFHLSQFTGLLMKSLRVHSRRWALTLLVLLLPLLYNVLSNLISRRRQDFGIFAMDVQSLNPQTILVRSDPTMIDFFQSTVMTSTSSRRRNGVTLEERSESLEEMNTLVRDRRMHRPSTYTEIYLAFDVSPFRLRAASSNLISSYEVIDVASNLFYKYAMNDTDVSIKTTLVYKTTGNWTEQFSIGDLMNILSMASCALKFLPTSLLLDVFLFYLLFFYSAVFLISERKDRFLSLLNISGLHPASYWLFNYLFDVVLTVIWLIYLLSVFCMVDLAFNGRPSAASLLEFASPWDLRIQFYPLAIFIALPTLPMVYLLTKFFTSDILGGMTILFLLIVVHFISILLPVMSILIRDQSKKTFLFWLFNLICPSVNAQVLITDILVKNSRFCRLASLLFQSIGDETIVWNVLILLGHVFFFLVLLIVIDTGLLRFSFSCFYSSSNFDERRLDDDVLVERHRVLTENNDDHLTVKDLVKFYPVRRVVPVNHLTFGVKRGEAFGLLGYNGAGKTTTFRILVGDLIGTRGAVSINGENDRRRLGYCPQENCSMEFLTVQDSLYLLGRIRGVRSSHLSSMVSTISSLFLLDPFRKNYIHQLSGGTKRRLHAALALIGPPSVAILDEPTTGVDPTAREQMQEIFVNAVKMKRTLILTSHSMDECERVCHRLGIMKQGQLACLGTIQHLKSKFGHGYTIEVKVSQSSMSLVEAFFHSQDVDVKETTDSTGIFQSRDGTPAELFQLLEENKQRLKIETYSISQTTLEQIFLSFGEEIRVSNVC